MSRLMIASFFCLLMFATPPAHAWNNTGHMTVAKLAWERLDNAQRQAAYDTLKELPEFALFIKERPQPDNVKDPREWAFLNAATWPDYLRGFDKRQDQPYKDLYANQHKPKWHYADFPLIAPEDARSFSAVDLTPDLGKLDDIISRLEWCQWQMPTAHGPDKAVALCWLLHLTGDLHQPLHCVGFYSHEYKTGDQGGNRRWVKNRNTPIRLHAYWDNIPDDLTGAGHFTTGYVPDRQTIELVNDDYGLLTRPAYGADAFKRELARKDVTVWADEGKELARTRVYEYNGKRIGGLPVISASQFSREELDRVTASAPPLPAGYGEVAAETARRQLALAGHRLTQELAAAFPAARQSP